MGWNSEKKKEALITQRSKLIDIIASANETIQTCHNKAQRIQRQYVAIERIQEIKSFSEIDAGTIQRSIHKIEGQITALRKGNKQLDALKQQLTDIGEQIDQAITESDKLKNQRTELSIEGKRMQGVKDELGVLLTHLTEEDKDKLLSFQAEHGQILSNATLETIDAIYHDFKSNTEKLKDAAVLESNTQRNQVDRSITRIKNPSQELSLNFQTGTLMYSHFLIVQTMR
jgi:uncharacterized protein YPO0396